MKRDLAKLYSELGLQPDCSLDEFNRTYRRRIAELHPDKGVYDASGETQSLPEIIWLYATATRFHRRYGRLPGAVPARARDPARLPTSTALPASATTSDAPLAAQMSARDRGSDALPRRAWLMALLLLAVLLILALSWT